MTTPTWSRRLAAGLAGAAALALSAAAGPPATAADQPWLGKDIAYAVEVEAEGYYWFSERSVSGEDWGATTSTSTSPTRARWAPA